jgi:hypothetical protein
MDGPGVDQKIRFGYYKAAQKLGKDFSLYRASNPISPIDPLNLQGVVKCAFTISWDWMKANRPGNAIWYLLTDGQESSGILNVRECDFLVDVKQTFFVLAKQYQMPMLAVECNSILRIIRPDQTLGPGIQPYGGYLPANSQLLVDEMPASTLLDRIGSNAITKLPTDSKQSSWVILMPNIDSTDIKTGDIVIDESNQQYLITLSERTDFIWRIKAMQMVT